MTGNDSSGDDSGKDFGDVMSGVFIGEDDLTADRLTELFRHKRVHRVDETDNGFQFLFREGNTITVDPSTGGEIDGPADNKYMLEKKRGKDDREGLSAENILELGDLVRLKEPYDHANEYIEYTHGIIVEIDGYFGGDLSGVPRKVSLHLYNPQTRDVYLDSSDRHGSPVFVDQHIRQLNLVQKASDETYHARDIDIAEYIDLGDRW